MNHNCFTFTIGELIHQGVVCPDFGGYSLIEDRDKFVNEQNFFLQHRFHYKYFESFCTNVLIAKHGDVILSPLSVGFAINKQTYFTIRERNGEIVILPIGKKHKILRVYHG